MENGGISSSFGSSDPSAFRGSRKVRIQGDATAHVRPQGLWDRHPAVLHLALLHDGDQGPARRDGRGIQGMDRRVALGGPVAHPEAVRLVVRAVGA